MIKKFWSLLTILLIATMILSACAKATTEAPVLLQLADDFLAEYNVELVVEDLGRVQDIRPPMITAAPAGEGPDIFIGVHDWLGARVESGLVALIDLGA